MRYDRLSVPWRKPLKGILPLLTVCVLLASALLLQTAVVDPNSLVRAASSDPIIAAAGDIACDPADSTFQGGNGTGLRCRQKYTSNLLVNANLAAVLALGDNQYFCGGYQAFVQSYDLSWGRVKSITKPVVGNHEYLTYGGTDCTAANAEAAGYFKYFGTAAGNPTQGYYSYNIGAWHLIALNSNCSDVGDCSLGSPQYQWLQSDLAAHPNQCLLAYWHIPLYSSGGRAANNTRAFWQLLYNAKADVILNGHDHIYERFAPQDPNGLADSINGIREFIAGTGGANHTSIAASGPMPNSEVINTDTYGVLKLTLHPHSYGWKFVPEAGETFTDSGTNQCHNSGGAIDSTPPTAPSNLSARAISTTQIKLSWGASTDKVGVQGYLIFRNGMQIATTSNLSYVDTKLQPATSYSYSVAAYDGAGNISPASNSATATTPPDTTAPTAPTKLTARVISSQQVSLSWKAATDDTGVTGYSVFRNGEPIATTSNTSYSDRFVQPNTQYSYTVVAYDAAGNTSPPSNTATATTPKTNIPNPSGAPYRIYIALVSK